jgi:hypothetical protein
VAARCRWQDNIELYLTRTGSEGVEWTDCSGRECAASFCPVVAVVSHNA